MTEFEKEVLEQLKEINISLKNLEKRREDGIAKLKEKFSHWAEKKDSKDDE